MPKQTITVAKRWMPLILSCTILLCSLSMTKAEKIKTIILPVQSVCRNLKELPTVYDAQYGFTRNVYEVSANKTIAAMQKSSAHIDFLPFTKIAAITDSRVHNWYLMQLKAPIDEKKIPDFDKLKSTIYTQTGASVFVKPSITVVHDNGTPVMVTLEYWILDNVPDSIDEKFNMVSKIDCPFEEMMTDLMTRFLQDLPEQITTKVTADQQTHSVNSHK